MPSACSAILRLIAAGALISGCAASSAVVLPSEPQTDSLARLTMWRRNHPLADDQEIRVDELDRSEHMSLHVVQIRSRESLHVHQRHDLVARLEHSHGTLVFGSHRLRLAAGSVVMIPRGVPHAFLNESPQPAVAVVIFSPPFDGQDTVPAAP